MMGSTSIGGVLTLLSCLLLLQNTSTNAFVPQRNQVRYDSVIGHNTNIIKQSIGSSKLYGKWESYDPSDDNPSYEDALARNKARTDVRNFLTQRAIQSFICLLDHCRDPHTVAWVEKTMDCKNIGSFHGTGAFNLTTYPTWETPLVDLVSQPKETVVVQIRRRRTRRRKNGWSNNGYLDGMGNNNSGDQNDSSKKSKPATKAVSHVMNNNYLESMSNANNNDDNSNEEENGMGTKQKDDSIKNKQKKRHKKKKTKMSARKEKKKSDQPSNNNPFLKDVFVDYEIDIDPTSIVSRIISVREQIANEWLQDLETMIETNNYVLQTYLAEQTESRVEREATMEKDGITVDEGDDDDEEDPTFDALTAPYSSNEDPQDQEAPVVVFDRNAMAMLTNSMGSQDRDSSPLRRSNFDLLLLLCTQESIHRVLRSYRDEDRVESLAWLRDFYISRVSELFDGHNQIRGRGDLFLEELLLSTPSMVRKDDELHLIDPLRMAEDIIRERSRVADDWKQLVNQTSDDHMGIRRIILAKMMGGSFDPATSISPSSSKYSSGSETKAADLFEAGGFE